MNDTRNPNSGPSGGSRSNVFCGNAITVACRMLVDAMKKADGSYRNDDEMKAENLPLGCYIRWSFAAAQTACSESTAQGAPFPIYMYMI